MEPADRLTEATGFDTVFFNSGAEANEGMFKLARKYGSSKNPDKNVIVTLKQSFHGRTITTVTATGQDSSTGSSGRLRRVSFTPSQEISVCARCAARPERVRLRIRADPGRRRRADNLARVPSGCGKASRQRDIPSARMRFRRGSAEPVLSLRARSWAAARCDRRGGGLAWAGAPIGAVLARGKAADVFQPGDHGTTSAEALAAAAALVVLSRTRFAGLLDEVDRKGRHLMSRIEEPSTPSKDVRGMGLMVGIGVGVDPHEVVDAARAHRLLVLTAGDDTVRLLPPLVITMKDIDEGVAALNWRWTMWKGAPIIQENRATAWRGPRWCAIKVCNKNLHKGGAEGPLFI